MQGTSEILLTSIGLENVNNYHEFCRLLSRFRSTHQCNEITEKPGYGEWLDLVANFSVKGFQAWQVIAARQKVALMLLSQITK